MTMIGEGVRRGALGAKIPGIIAHDLNSSNAAFTIYPPSALRISIARLSRPSVEQRHKSVSSYGFLRVTIVSAGVSGLAITKEFLGYLEMARSVEGLREALDEISRVLGFNHYALIHHADLRLPGVLRIENYPREWAELFVRERLYRNDPILRASQLTNVGFRWSEVIRRLHLSRAQQHILDSASQAGMGEGYTVPAFVPGERIGSCSFAMRVGEPLPESALLSAELVGGFAFQAARRVVGLERRGWAARPRLTERQIECVALVAQGKTDWEIANILGLHEDTVTEHVDNARARYGVYKRIQLVVAAAHDGLIGLHHIVSWH